MKLGRLILEWRIDAWRQNTGSMLSELEETDNLLRRGLRPLKLGHRICGRNSLRKGK
jgi:hypothetical protein